MTCEINRSRERLSGALGGICRVDHQWDYFAFRHSPCVVIPSVSQTHVRTVFRHVDFNCIICGLRQRHWIDNFAFLILASCRHRFYTRLLDLHLEYLKECENYLCDMNVFRFTVMILQIERYSRSLVLIMSRSELLA
jgi:hypothetical protein